MDTSYFASLLLLACAGVVYLRPQWISTLRRYTDAERRNIEMRRVRRTAAGGLLALALLIGPGSRGLAWLGVSETTLTVLRIILVTIGVIVIMTRIETRNHNTNL
ncbi:MAG: hypothetical protein NC209_07850 [Alistipes sp.]|nr:hypothetical protein [Alistipes senegalensis]MCM1251039.1 hypothetical protein [Alistipes sp.]